MAKLKRYEDPYKSVRRSVPPINYYIRHDKEYDRNKQKYIIEELIEEGFEEYEEEENI